MKRILLTLLSLLILSLPVSLFAEDKIFVMQAGGIDLSASSGPLNLGAAASTSHSLGVGDVLVGGKLEVDGISYFDGTDLITQFGDSASKTYIQIAGNRCMLGFDGTRALIQGGGGKSIAFTVNESTFGLGSPDAIIDTNLNFGLGTLTFGTNFAGGIGMAIGTAPTTSPADMAQMWVDDYAAGDARWYFQGEASTNKVVIGNGKIITTDNLLVNNPTENGNLAGGIIIKNGTVASAAVTDGIQIYAADTSDNTSTWSLYSEQTVEAIGTFTPSNKLKIIINGTAYWIQLDAV